ncbi:MAG: glycine betaine ABC transporter substrate-binding protein [Cryobacterium sp.]|nr:glycine betaine ABC transporter substrate-binding protein [Micrococcales bacterium]MBX3078169.1 glycine betaine ABC transporter substrate-binding protein [Cryobacterium sp.]HNP15338.1 glycine betaine ABC transporter substrate-binding protein [Terrimesophilobacter sp.]
MKKRLLAALAIGAVATLGLGACATGSGTGSDNGSQEQTGDKMDLTIGVFNGWPEGEAASILWKLALEKKGYNVTLEYADAGPVFLGLSQGDYDVAFDGWLPRTHATYMKEYGDKLTDLGAWNDEAALTMAVNADAPIDSLDELAAHAGEFGNRIVGIEPGAGLTEAVQKAVIPEYGLEKMDFVTSSTPAMLAELKSALDKKENIVVTLWRPHWAYDEYNIKDLKDPKGTLGTAESIHSIARGGFAADYPQLTKWINNFAMSSDLLYSLENVLYNSGADASDYETIVSDWMADHQDYVDGLTQ